MKDERVSSKRFLLEHSRKMNEHTLSNNEEVLISGLGQDGLDAWEKLYQTICGSMKFDVGGELIGCANAASLMRNKDRAKREQAYVGLKEAFEFHENSFAAILNSINGWRLEVSKHRSHKKELHYLDISCHQGHISRKTLDSLISATCEMKNIGHRALRAQAKLIGVDKLAPWDLQAPCPLGSVKEFTFPEAIEIITECFSDFDPKMGEFVQHMYKMNWIDAGGSENRSPGAYCTGLSSVREPRVFMTFGGSMGHVLTLAHEVGHAYHSWVMRDMPFDKTHYSMTLAETASIFAETLVRDYLYSKAETREDKLAIAWQDVSSASVLLINIPARYEFEKKFVEKRKENFVSPAQLKELMNESWDLWYEGNITENDTMFWANKLHFSIARLGFYNYPYLFGYLFSLSIYAQKDSLGEAFKGKYIDILRDTGTMTAEDLIQKHLGQDISSPAFWKNGLKIVEGAVARLEELI